MPNLLALAVLVLLVLMVSLLVAIYVKVVKAHRTGLDTLDLAMSIQAQSEALFPQLQSLYALEHTLSLAQPLPPMRGWAGSPDFLLHIVRRIRSHRVQTVLECGSGVSTVVSARALQLAGSGHVYSLEHDAEYAQKTRDLLAEYGLAEWATVVHAPLVSRDGEVPWYQHEALPKSMPPVDLLVVDGPPAATATQARYPALPRLIDRLSPRFTIFVDDADRVEDTAVVNRWASQFPGLKVSKLPAEKGLAVIEGIRSVA